MIRLLTRNYTVKELIILRRLFKKMYKEMSEICEYNTDNDCRACEFRHICYDIEHATVHTKKLINSIYRKDFNNVTSANNPTNAERPETETENPV
ncbi:MAG: hypothetical protein J6R32_03120 [Bacteroidales bacterium]|nr:hypothetical protein [Bacteroidales bacterium]